MLSGKQKRYLRAKGSLIKPSVNLGKEGLSEPVVEEANRQLESTELIKVRLQKSVFEKPSDVARQLAEQTQSELVGTAGRTFLLYRENPDKKQFRLP